MSIAATGFECGVMMAVATLVQTKGNTKIAAAIGGATTIAITAFIASFSFFSQKLKYIDERTEESN